MSPSLRAYAEAIARQVRRERDPGMALLAIFDLVEAALRSVEVERICTPSDPFTKDLFPSG